mgnify:CR=1 FL=1
MSGEGHGVFFQGNPWRPNLLWSSLVIHRNAVVPQHPLTDCGKTCPVGSAHLHHHHLPLQLHQRHSKHVKSAYVISMFCSRTRQPATQHNQPPCPNAVGKADQ